MSEYKTIIDDKFKVQDMNLKEMEQDAAELLELIKSHPNCASRKGKSTFFRIYQQL